MKRHTQKQLLHLLAGLIIVVIAFNFFERNDIIQATVLFGTGCVFLILAGAHTWIDKNIRRISSFFFFIEAVIFYYAATHYKNIGSNQYNKLILGVAVIYILLGIVYVLTRKNKSKKYRSGTKRRNTKDLNIQDQI